MINTEPEQICAPNSQALLYDQLKHARLGIADIAKTSSDKGIPG